MSSFLPYFFSFPSTLNHHSKAEAQSLAVDNRYTELRKTSGKFHIPEVGKMFLFDSATFIRYPTELRVTKDTKISKL